MEGSAGAVVAAGQIKAAEQDFFLHVELLQFLLFARSSRRSFLRTVQSIQQYGSALSETDVIQTESPENFVVIFEILPIDKGMKEQRNYLITCRCWASCGFNGRNATHQVDFFSRHRLQSNSNSSTVFCFTEQNSNSVSFSPSQCCRLLKVLLSRFSSEVDVILGEVVHHKFQAHRY